MRALSGVAAWGLASCLLLLGSCGGSNGIARVYPDWSNGRQAGTPAIMPVALNQEHAGSGFAIEPIGNDALLQLELAVSEQGAQAVVQVVSASEQSLAEVILELLYDPELYTPLAAQATEAIAPLSESLCMQWLDTPGIVSLGQVALDGQAHQVQMGEVLAEVLFACEPLSAVSAKAAAQVPVHKGALSPLIWDEDAGEFSWYYVNPGDYNQNGLVDISDISPLGREFGQAGPFAFTTAQSVIDGNSDGQIGIADLSTIGQYCGSRVEGYNLYASEDINDVPAGFADPSTLDPAASFSLAEAQGDALSDRLWFSYTPSEEEEGLIFWARPYALGEEGTRSNICSTDMDSPPLGPDGFNLPPEARLGLTYTGASVPLEVTFDATASRDPDGTIIFYEWDFQGDGLFDAFSTGAVALYTYIQSGTYSPLVRVTDNDGLWDTFRAAEFTVTESEVSNIPPVADLIATVTEGEAPLTVGLIAAGSFDPDGQIVKYEWDFDGDGEYDLDSGADPTVLHVYEDEGTLDTTVRVTDDGGDSATSEQLVTVLVPPEIIENEAPVAYLSVGESEEFGNAPHTVHFDGSNSVDPDGAVALYEWDYNGDGVYDSYGNAETCEYIYELYGTYSPKLRITDDRGAQATATVGVHVNAVPIATLHTVESEVELGETIEFYLLTYDFDGEVVGADWDIDGDGSFNESSNIEKESQNIGNIELTVNWTGNRTAWIRVTDNDGATAYASTDYKSISDWFIVTLDSSASQAGMYNSLAVVDGNPAISYITSSHELRYIRSNSATGSRRLDWGAPLVIDAAGPATGKTALAVVDGKPAVVYESYPAINYIRAATSAGTQPTDWTSPAAVAVGGLGSHSFTFVDGNPAVAYYERDNRDLMYVRSTTATGDNGVDWAEKVIIDSVGEVGSGASIAVVSGCPAISYCDRTNWNLKYARATTSTGSNVEDWANTITVDSNGAAGLVSSLAVVDGRPAISYDVRGSYPEKRYIISSSATGSNLLDWSNSIKLEDLVGAGDITLATYNGYPVICYPNRENCLGFAQSATTTGAGADDWLNKVSVDGHGGGVGVYSSFAIVDGHPAISYYDGSYPRYELKYAIYIRSSP